MDLVILNSFSLFNYRVIELVVGAERLPIEVWIYVRTKCSLTKQKKPIKKISMIIEDRRIGDRNIDITDNCVTGRVTILSF